MKNSVCLHKKSCQTQDHPLLERTLSMHFLPLPAKFSNHESSYSTTFSAICARLRLPREKKYGTMPKKGDVIHVAAHQRFHHHGRRIVP